MDTSITVLPVDTNEHQHYALDSVSDGQCRLSEFEEYPNDADDLDRRRLVSETHRGAGRWHGLCGRWRGRSDRVPAWHPDAVLYLAQHHPAFAALRTLSGAGLCRHGQFGDGARW